jgi:hypothetical protein
MATVSNIVTGVRRGTRVEVRNRFDSAWSHGFEVARVDRDGYRLRRLSDRAELPVVFRPDDVRPTWG